MGAKASAAGRSFETTLAGLLRMRMSLVVVLICPGPAFFVF